MTNVFFKHKCLWRELTTHEFNYPKQSIRLSPKGTIKKSPELREVKLLELRHTYNWVKVFFKSYDSFTATDCFWFSLLIPRSLYSPWSFHRP